MSEVPDSLVLNLLRAIRGDIAEVKADIIEVKERLGILETQYASLSRRIDRIGGDMERVKHRFELTNA